MSGVLCTLSVDLAANVHEVQKQIAEAACIPVREQCLLCNQREVKASERIGEALAGEDEITVVRCDARVMAIKSAMQTGALALERARSLASTGALTKGRVRSP